MYDTCNTGYSIIYNADRPDGQCYDNDCPCFEEDGSNTDYSVSGCPVSTATDEDTKDAADTDDTEATDNTEPDVVMFYEFPKDTSGAGSVGGGGVVMYTIMAIAAAMFMYA